jgi:putative acetyltransferase
MIRAFEAQDIEQVVAVWRAASRESHGFIDEGYWVGFEQKMRAVTLLTCQTSVFDDGGIQGFVCVNGDHVDALFVGPEHQRRGIGKVLLEHAKASSAQLTLAVFAENAMGMDFYRREGFAVLSERPNDPTGRPMAILRWSRTNDL